MKKENFKDEIFFFFFLTDGNGKLVLEKHFFTDFFFIKRNLERLPGK